MVRYLALFLFLVVTQVHTLAAANCPPLLDAALAALSDDKPEPLCQYRGQEPGSNKGIAKFCEANYGVSFPMFAKTSVARGDVNPFHAKLAASSGARPGWNFHKYLMDRKGAKALSFDTRVAPGDPKLVKEIERLLAEQGEAK